jgi:hypothetical protein
MHPTKIKLVRSKPGFCYKLPYGFWWKKIKISKEKREEMYQILRELINSDNRCQCHVWKQDDTVSAERGRENNLLTSYFLSALLIITILMDRVVFMVLQQV